MGINKFNNHLDMQGNKILNARPEAMTQSQIDAIPVSTDADKAKQDMRAIFNTTTHQMVRFHAETGMWEVEGGAKGALNYRGKLDWSITTETDTVKQNPPALSASKNGDVWVVAKAGEYTFTDKDGNTHTQYADIGDVFQVVLIAAATPTTDEVIDWLFVESATHMLNLFFQYDASAPDTTSWEFKSYDASTGAVYDISKLGYVALLYKVTTTTGAGGEDIETWEPQVDLPTIIKDQDTVPGKTVFTVKVEFAQPLVSGDKFVIVLM